MRSLCILALVVLPSDIWVTVTGQLTVTNGTQQRIEDDNLLGYVQRQLLKLKQELDQTISRIEPKQNGGSRNQRPSYELVHVGPRGAPRASLDCSGNDERTVNLNLNNQPTWSSSNYAPYSSSSGRGVDGNRGDSSPHGCWTSNSEVRPWWAVDLGQPEIVQNVEITVRSDCCPPEASNLIIGLTNTPPYVTTPSSVLNGNYDVICGHGPTSAPNSGTFRVQCPLKIPATRYLVVQGKKAEAVHITFCEVDVYVKACSGGV